MSLNCDSYPFLVTMKYFGRNWGNKALNYV
jgi:hypothetical protein